MRGGFNLDIKVVSDDIAGIDADAIVLAHFEGDKEPGGDIASIDGIMGGAILEGRKVS